MEPVLDGELDVMPAFVREALDSLRPVPSPDPGAWAAARSAFLTEVRGFSVTAIPVRGRFWRRTLGSLPARRWGRVPATAVVSLIVVLALLLGGAVGTVSAAQASLPGSLLHPLKLRLEDLSLARAGDRQAAVRRAMAIASARVEEVRRLVAAGRPVPPEVAQRYQEHLTLAFGMAEMLPGASRAETLTQLEAEVSSQLTRVERAAAQGPDEDVAAARRMADTMREALGRDPQEDQSGGGTQPTETPTRLPNEDVQGDRPPTATPTDTNGGVAVTPSADASVKDDASGRTPTPTPGTGTGGATATPTQDPSATSKPPRPTATPTSGSDDSAVRATPTPRPTATTDGANWEARPTPTPRPSTGGGDPQVTPPPPTPPTPTRPPSTPPPPTPDVAISPPRVTPTPKPGAGDVAPPPTTPPTSEGGNWTQPPTPTPRPGTGDAAPKLRPPSPTGSGVRPNRTPARRWGIVPPRAARQLGARESAP